MTPSWRTALAVILAALVTVYGDAQAFYPGNLVPASCLGSAGPPNPALDGILADLDQDGDDDFGGLGGSTGSGGVTPANHITVCKALGGLLAPGVCHSTGAATPVTLAAGDLNGDGFRDLVVVCGGPSFALLSFINDGTGAFPNPPLTTTLPMAYTGVHVARIDGDSNRDVVLIAAGSASRILLGTGAGTFSATLVGPTAATASVIAWDDDGDGDDDLHEVMGGAFVTYRNQGSAFAPALVRFTTGFPTGFAAFGDFNSDGNPDAAAVGKLPAPSFQFAIQIAPGNGAGTFTGGPPQILGNAAMIQRIATRDCDGDGDLDLVAWIGTWTTYSPNTGGTFPSTTYLFHLASNPVIGDVTGDGIADVLVLRAAGWCLHPGVAQRGIASAIEHPLLPGGKAIRADDLDHDGLTDVIVGFRTPVTGIPFLVGVSFLSNLDVQGLPAGTGTVTTAEIADIATGDWDRDGLVDVLLARTVDLGIRLGTAGPLAPPWLATSVPVAGLPNSSILPGDLNRDGLLDVIVNQTAYVTVLLGNGAGAFPLSVVTPICPVPGACVGPPTMASADLDADGFLDLVVNVPLAAGGAPHFTVYLGNGAAAFTPLGNTPCVDSSWRPFLGDINGDAVPDLVLSAVAGGLEVRFGLGGGAFGPPAAYVASWPGTTAFLGGDLAVGDVDADGFPDVALAGGAVFRNTGSGSFVLPEVIGVSSVLPSPVAPTRVLFAQVSRDLQPDLLFRYPDGTVAVHRSLRPCPAIGYTYGVGCPGTGGFVPVLSAFGCASPGGTLTLQVADAVGGALAAAFVVGSAPAFQPLLPGCRALVPLLGSTIVPFPVSGPAIAGQGRSTISVAIPATVPSGISHALQAAILDPGAPLGWSATNGLALVIQ